MDNRNSIVMSGGSAASAGNNKNSRDFKNSIDSIPRDMKNSIVETPSSGGAGVSNQVIAADDDS